MLIRTQDARLHHTDASTLHPCNALWITIMWKSSIQALSCTNCPGCTLFHVSVFSLVDCWRAAHEDHPGELTTSRDRCKLSISAQSTIEVPDMLKNNFPFKWKVCTLFKRTNYGLCLQSDSWQDHRNSIGEQQCHSRFKSDSFYSHSTLA